MLEHPGWSGVLAVEEDIVMAPNKPVGDNARKGAVRKRSQLKTAPDEGIQHQGILQVGYGACRCVGQ